MKSTFTAAVMVTLVTIFASGVQAQGRHDEKPHAMPNPTKSSPETVHVPQTTGRHDERPHGVERANATGVVKRIDAAGKVIQLEHEPISTFKLKASTHDFSVKNAQALETLTKGDKVDFVLEKTGKNLHVVQISKSKQ